MPLRTPERRDSDIDAIGEALANLAGSETTEMPPTQVAAPLPVYTLDLESILAGSLDEAALTGWRYLLLSGDKAVAATEIQLGTGEEPGRFSHFEVGQVVDDSLEYFERAEHYSQQHDSREYELRFLDIPTLHVRAFWLRSEEEEIVLPLPSPQGDLAPGHAYNPQDFLGVLSAAAELQLSYADMPQEELPHRPAPEAQPCQPPRLSSCQLRNLHQGNAVRVPRRWDVGELSLLKSDEDWFVQVSQDRGYASERRIIGLADVVIVCTMTASFQRLVEDPERDVGKEDWDEWDPARGERYSGRREILELFKKRQEPDGHGQALTGAVYVRSNASVLVIAEFGLPADRSVEWKSPLPPPESLEGGGPGSPC